MPTLDARIDELVSGDALSIRRTIDRVKSGFQSGVVLTNAWLTVKAAIEDLDASAILQKAITTTNVAGVGHIENDGAGDVDPVVRFDLVPADTTAIGIPLRYYDIQVKTGAGDPYTPELGRINALDDVTDAT